MGVSLVVRRRIVAPVFDDRLPGATRGSRGAQIVWRAGELIEGCYKGGTIACSGVTTGAADVLGDVRSASETGAVGHISRLRQDAEAGARTDRGVRRQHPLSQSDA